MKKILVGSIIHFNINFAISITYDSQFTANESAGIYKYPDIFWKGIKQKFNFRNYKNQTTK